MEQTLQGKIGRFTLPEIFQLIATGQKTGTLGIQHDDDIVMVYFKKGKIIYGYGPRRTYHLGQLLRDRGRLTDKQLEDAVKTQSRKDASKRLGQILIDKKYISMTDLEEVVREQIEELIYSLLSWEKGTFKFYDNQYPTQEEITVDISVENAILEGCRRIDEENKANEVLPDSEDIVKITTTPSSRQSDILIESSEWNLVALIDGQRTVDDIIRQSGQPRTRVLNKLAAMKLAGLVTTVKASEEQPDRLTTMVNRVSELMENYLEQKRTDVKEELTVVHNLPEGTDTLSRLDPIDIITGVGEDD